jgi:KEOPS complex subunit Pcc1
MRILKQVESQIEIEFSSKNEAEIVLRSIEPELMDSPSDRSRTLVECQGNILKITITAIDSPSLRASLNSYLRWIMLSQQIIELKN